ncbi:hypothetical protein NDU88_002318 [Pleurodeles waltl]|uniref:Uncharacterized protein n=1 Tax=Pleurodeles waltl TaxID=8319 RepID=A0AAV7Q9H1_PLEWA|nr:hypothetical protein NDU88_002318 [Pleurodeles waltl]
MTACVMLFVIPLAHTDVIVANKSQDVPLLRVVNKIPIQFFVLFTIVVSVVLRCSLKNMTLATKLGTACLSDDRSLRRGTRGSCLDHTHVARRAHIVADRRRIG